MDIRQAIAKRNEFIQKEKDFDRQSKLVSEQRQAAFAEYVQTTLFPRWVMQNYGVAFDPEDNFQIVAEIVRVRIKDDESREPMLKIVIYFDEERSVRSVPYFDFHGDAVFLPDDVEQSWSWVETDHHYNGTVYTSTANLLDAILMAQELIVLEDIPTDDDGPDGFITVRARVIPF